MQNLLLTLLLTLIPAGAWGQEWVEIGNAADLQTQFNNTSGTTYIRLTQDFNGNGFVVKSGNTIVLDLNGHTIAKYNHYGDSYDYVNTGFIIKVEAGATLTIQDNSETHLGAIKDGRMKGTGGGIWNLGIFNFQSGTITGNNCYSNTDNFGGGVYNGGTMVMSGGTISNNHVYYSGGGIYNAASATLTITGGTITGNDCYSGVGGGIYNAGTLTISGNPTITTNIRTYGGISANNVYLPNDKKITIGTGGLNGDAKNIGITMQTPGTFTTGATSENDYTKFFSDDNHYEAVAVSIDGDAGDNNVKLKSCWSLLDKQIAEATSGNITLTKDYEAVTTDTYLSVPNSQNITLELNGHTLNRNTSAKADGCVIRNLGTLTIQDNSTGSTGIITGGNNTNGGGGIHNEGTLTIKSGKIQSNTSSYSGAGIYNAGTLTVDGGFIQSNTTTKLGAGIYNESGKNVTINSGTIQSNTNNGEHGGGIYNDGTLTINGGSISNNTLSIASKHGGGIYNAGTLSINGGTIQNNTVKDNTGLGAGIYHDGTAFNLQGAPDISSNKIVNTSTQRNVYLTAAHHTITITGTLENTTPIGINMESPSYDATSDTGVFTSGLSSYGTIANFTSEAANTIRLTDYNKGFSHTEGELISYWSYLNRQFADNISSITLDAGTYQATSTEPYLHVPNRTVELNLNGQTLNRNVGNTAKQDGCVLYNEGTLTIMGTGIIQGGNNNGTGMAQGGGIYNTGKLYLQGGSIYRNYTSINGGGIYNAGELTFSGGYVSENWATESGNGIYNHTGGIMTLSGGTIQGNSHTAGNGGGIYNNGTLTVTSGTISGNEVNVDGKHGGGVYNVGTMTFSGGNIQSNWAKGNGGGIYNNGELTMSGGSILNNGYYTSGNSTYYRGENGTGIYNNGTLNLTGGTITGNRFDGSGKNGAGIYNNGTFNLAGGPTITSNTGNVYLPKAHHIINITGALTNTTKIGIRMEEPDEFTSGLLSGQSGGKGTSANFTSENSANHRLIDTEDTHEAALATHWNFLKYNMEKADVASFTLESGCSYVAGSKDSYLHIPSGKTFTLDLNGNTINRNLTSSTAKANGCVIFNEGNLTITGSGTIRGGSNTDATDIKGGGICNVGSLIIQGGTIRNNTTYSHGGGIYNYGTTEGKGALTIEGGTIQYNGVTNSSYGGGIYHNGTTFKMKGDPYILGNTANSADNNIYLETGKKITITGKLTSTESRIGITSVENHPVFTSGLRGYDDDATRLGNASNFKADLTTHGIGLDSNGEAIVGPKYNVTRVRSTYWETYSYVYIKGDSYNAMTAVEGETVKVKIRGESTYGTIPVSFDCDGVPFHSYPEADVEYSFVMPAHDVTVTGECQRGGYCGEADEKDIKYYLKDGTLYFMTKDANSYEMQNYAYGSVPWSNLSYTAINIPTTVTTISPYAFYGKDITTANIHQYIIFIGEKAFMGCTHLTNINVDGSNANYSSSDGVLYNKAKEDLICYPAGKEDHSYTLPSTVQTIAEGAFAFGSHLQTIAVAGGSSFKSVEGVLYNNAGTTLVYYPAGNNSVFYEVPTTATVGPYAFHNAKNLTHLFLLHNAVPTGSTAMFDESTFYIMVSNSIKSSYEGTSPWSNYATRYRSIALSNAAITLEYTSVDYNGTALKPNVVSVIKDNRTLTPTTDYTVGYSNNTEVGTATVTITGQGVYAGSSIDKTFTITRYVNFGTVTGKYVTYFASEDLNRPADVWNSSVLENDSWYHPYRAYTITAIDWARNSITLQPISSDEKGYIPKGMPVLLYNMFFNEVANPVFHLTKYTGTATSVSPSSDFKGVSTSTSYSELIEGYADLYVLRNDKFVRATGGDLPTNKLPANRCYIARPTSVSSAPAYLSISGIDDNTTGITMEGGRGKTEELFSSDWYTVNGVKLDGMPTKKGIYINNGRKVIIK